VPDAANIDVRYRTEVAAAGGDGRLQHLDLRDRDSGQIEHTPAAGLFVLIGALRYWDMLAARVCERIRMVTVRAYVDRYRAAWPAEFPPPATKTGFPAMA